MTKRIREDKKVAPSLWGLMVAINSEHMPLVLPPLKPASEAIAITQLNEAAGVDVPIATAAAKDEEKKDEVSTL